MAEKKEIIDYLRNQQKSAEIEAKINGVNSWVLLGAMSIVAWSLLGTAELSIWSNYELLVRVLVSVQAALLITRGLKSYRKSEPSIRFASWRLKDMDTPLLDFFYALLLVCPTALLFLIYKDYTALISGIVGIVFLYTSCSAMYLLIRNHDVECEKLPEPIFSNRGGITFAVTILFNIGFIFLFIYQTRLVAILLPEPKIDSAKALACLAALYILILLAIERKAFNESIKWTYTLETDLLLDNLTPDVALRKIEHRALGPRLQDVMDLFFDGIEKKFSILNDLRSECLIQIHKINEIPKEYSAERNARIENATSNFYKVLNEIENECEKLSKYISRLESNKFFNNNLSIKFIKTRYSENILQLKKEQEFLKNHKKDFK